jgi:cytidylate kinase
LGPKNDGRGLQEPTLPTAGGDVAGLSIIAIDGPAASGKSTLGRLLAQELGYLYFDTGAMYRAVTLAALNAGIDPHDEARVADLASSVSIDIQPPTCRDGRMCDVLLEGQDVTWEIRSAEVEAHVSQVSAYPEVRRAMGERQREIGLRGEVVMVGRDIGTVILPEADVKIYLVASVEERSRRRHQEALARGIESEYGEVLAAMKARDEFDSSREHAPLRPAQDAIVLDSTNLSVDQMLRRALQIVAATHGESESR